MNDIASVVAEATAADGHPCVAVKISTETAELNLWIPKPELPFLATVKDAKSNAGSVKIGRAAGADAWWAADHESNTLTILVGRDDETWDVGFTFPLGLLGEIAAAVKACEP